MSLRGEFERTEFDEDLAAEFATYLASPISDSPTSNTVGGMALFDHLSFERVYKDFLEYRERGQTIEHEPVSEQGRAAAERRKGQPWWLTNG